MLTIPTAALLANCSYANQESSQ